MGWEGGAAIFFTCQLTQLKTCHFNNTLASPVNFLTPLFCFTAKPHLRQVHMTGKERSLEQDGVCLFLIILSSQHSASVL